VTRFMLAVLLIATNASLAAAPPAPPAPPAQEPAATQPMSPEEAMYRAHLELLEVLLDDPSNEDLFQAGKFFRRQDDHAKAAVFDLMALRGKPNDHLIEYELACDFSLWGQKKLAAKYLMLAAEHGYWGYRVLVDDTDLDAIKDTPEFAAATRKIKANFDVEAPKNGPGMTVAKPDKGAAPADGWPVLIFLHGWGSHRADFDEEAKMVSTLGYVGVTLDAGEVMGPGAYTWDRKTVEPTDAQIQAALKKIDVKIDPKRVYLQGFSQGAMHAARLMADYPGFYRGAICNSPGSAQLTPTTLKNPGETGPIILSIGDHDINGVRDNVAKIAALWKGAGRSARIIKFSGGHQLPPKPDQMFRDAIKQFNEGM
jgi:predicted esterase